MSSELHARFWAKVDKSGDCWVWTASRNRDGYGWFRFWDGMRKAHQMAWALTFGEWPRPCVLHCCDNRRCVRPEHLRVGSHEENMEEMVRKRRFEAKLNDEDIRRIRSLNRAGFNRRQIGRILGMSREHVRDILKGRRWHYVVDAA